MPLESTTTIAGLDNANPHSSDDISQGDDHFRLLKAVLKNIFPGANGQGFASVIEASEVELNYLLNARSNIQAQIDALDARITSNAEAIALLQTAIDEINAAIDAINSVIADLQDQIDSINTTIGNLMLGAGRLWSDLNNYNTGDLVTQGDYVFMANADSLDKDPSIFADNSNPLMDPIYWTLVASLGVAHAANRPYSTGDIATSVTLPLEVFVATSSTTNDNPIASDKWQASGLDGALPSTGIWLNDTNYVIGDVVEYNSTTYIAKINNTAVTPTVTNTWADAAAVPSWSSVITYNAGDTVKALLPVLDLKASNTDSNRTDLSTVNWTTTDTATDLIWSPTKRYTKDNVASIDGKLFIAIRRSINIATDNADYWLDISATIHSVINNEPVGSTVIPNVVYMLKADYDAAVVAGTLVPSTIYFVEIV